MKNLLFRIFYKFAISTGIGIFSFLGPLIIAGESKNGNLSIKSNSDFQFYNNLLEIPIGNFESASKRVKKNRNPFQDSIQSDFSKIANINSVLKFKGLVKSEDNLMAIIYTNDGQNIYKVGDDIGNGFLVKSISIENKSVDISNGFKNYRLSLTSYKNQL